MHNEATLWRARTRVALSRWRLLGAVGIRLSPGKKRQPGTPSEAALGSPPTFGFSFGSFAVMWIKGAKAAFFPHRGNRDSRGHWYFMKLRGGLKNDDRLSRELVVCFKCTFSTFEHLTCTHKFSVLFLKDNYKLYANIHTKVVWSGKQIKFWSSVLFSSFRLLDSIWRWVRNFKFEALMNVSSPKIIELTL